MSMFNDVAIYHSVGTIFHVEDVLYTTGGGSQYLVYILFVSVENNYSEV